ENAPGAGPVDPRQTAFRKRVLDSGVTAKFFVSPDALKHEVYRVLKEKLPKPPGADVPLQHLDYRAPNFQGRQHELQELLALLRSSRAQGTALSLVSLKGMGGVGKSALAAELAESLRQDVDAFPGGVLWTNLLEKAPADAAQSWLST